MTEQSTPPTQNIATTTRVDTPVAIMERATQLKLYRERDERRERDGLKLHLPDPLRN